MAIHRRTIEEVKERADVEAVCSAIGLDVKVRGGWGKCLCPFHHEKAASFGVNISSGGYNCFSCHASGDIIDLVIRLTGASFADAVRLICAESGIRVVETDDATDLRDNGGFHKALSAVRDAIESKVGNGFGRCTLDSSLQWALNEICLDCEPREYLIIRSPNGTCVAIAGRSTTPTASKWMNSKFTKGDTLYGYYETRRRPGPLYIVEGYGDVERLAAEGYAACALMGSGLCGRQMQILAADGRGLVVCMDGDKPGQEAAVRISKALMRARVEHDVHIMPDGCDPGGSGLEGHTVPCHVFLAPYYVDALVNGKRCAVTYAIRESVAAILDSEGNFDDARHVMIVRDPNDVPKGGSEVCVSYMARQQACSSAASSDDSSLSEEEKEAIRITIALGDAFLADTPSSKVDNNGEEDVRRDSIDGNLRLL